MYKTNTFLQFQKSTLPAKYNSRLVLQQISVVLDDVQTCVLHNISLPDRNSSCYESGAIIASPMYQLMACDHVGVMDNGLEDAVIREKEFNIAPINVGT